MATVGDIEHITSTVTEGTSTTVIMFRLEKNLFEAVNDVRAAVSNIRSDLPSDLREPIVGKVDTAGQPILTFTVASDRMDDEALSWFVDNTVSRNLLAVRGVGAVDARRRRRPRGARRARPGAPAGAERHRGRHLAQLRQDRSDERRAGAPTSAAPSSRCARSPRAVGRRAGAAGDRAPRRPPHPARSGRDDQRHRRRAALALALLDGKPVVGFEVARTRGASEVDVAARRRAGARDA